VTPFLLRLQVRLEGQTAWLSQRVIAELYQVSVKTVNEHLGNIYDEGELDAEATVRSFRIVQREGARDVPRTVEHYNLDAVLAVGYRVRSARGTAFRQRATIRLGELQAVSRKPMTMSDWIAKLDDFIRISDRQILSDRDRAGEMT